MQDRFRNLPIAAKVLVAPLFVLACLLLIAAAGYLSGRDAEQALSNISGRALPDVEAVSQLKTRTAKLDAQVMRSLAYEAGGMKAKRIEALDKAIFKELSDFAQHVATLKQAGGPELAAHYAAIEKALSDFTRAARDTIEMKSGGVGQAAMMMTSAESAFGKLEKAVDALSAEISQRASGQASQAAAKLNGARAVSLATLAAALVISLFVIGACVRLITRPLREAADIARAVAAGDLRQAVHTESRDETGQVLAAMADLCGRLNALLGGVQQAAQQIEGASAELASGNLDLSNRTEQTASSLQGTVATVALLTEQVQRNSEATARANELAGRSAQLARDGGQVMRDVVQAMSQINGQSRRIADIIAVIDGLAFQTNLLALNAAVEAARAGEQGRGFAVVAQEVRGLATRSAGAAKEIRALIETSVEHAGTGTRHVESASRLIGEVVGAVEDVSRLMDEVARANGEQVRGVTEVSGAIARMDAATQQNAALVEQAAAATQALNQQTQGLRTSLAVFQTA